MTIDDITNQLLAIKVLERCHIKWRGRCALFFVLTHMQILMIGATIGYSMD